MTGETPPEPRDSHSHDVMSIPRMKQTMTTKRNVNDSLQTLAEHDGPRESAKPARATMFYDGGCPLCSREVAHYQRLDKNRRIELIDIHAHPHLVDSIGVNHEEAMARLHVRDETGQVQTGVWAFAAIWDALPYYRWLARTLRALRLLPALDLAYTWFARWRFKRRACATGSCTRA